MKNPTLISKIKSLEALTAEEKAELIALLNNTKKYGLVWEDKPEAVEELLRTQLPVLQEVPERRILAKELPAQAATISGNTDPNQPGLFDEQPNAASTGSAAGYSQQPTAASTTPASTSSASGNLEQRTMNNEQQTTNTEHQTPNHILIEGDNLHALTALTFTHEGKIDVIYIDPPYNTGNKDFKYNDSFVDREDSYRHSKWLSFMKKRLELAKRLLSEKGVIFISIDDNEQAQLKLLCDEVFGEENYIGDCVWKRRASSGLSNFKFSKDHEYVKIFRKTAFVEFTGIEKTYGRYSNPDNDERGDWIADNLTVGMGKDQRPNQFYELVNPETGIAYPPNPNRVWAYIPESMEKLIKENRIIFPKSNTQRPLLKRFKKELRITDNPISSLINLNFNIGLNSEGTKTLQDFGLDGSFVYPKPTTLVKSLISIYKGEDSIILDFFAGSGTTLHATMQLNAEDGGSRQCILVTNNENNIAEEVCYERNRRVIQGYANAKGENVPGLTGNNLRYYRTGFVGNAKTTKNKKQLTRLATELLCIKEDIYTETGQMAGFVFDADTARCFCADNKYMLVIYDEEMIEELVPVIAAIPTKHKIKIYVFAPGQYPFTEEFEEVLDKVELCALPDAIYKAYASVLPKKTSKRHAADETQPAENQESTEVDLFTTNTPEA